jgi:hypothetical protein
MLGFKPFEAAQRTLAGVELMKWVTRPMVGFTSFDAAQFTLVGIELMHRLKKGQLAVEAGADSLTPAEQFYALAA